MRKDGGSGQEKRREEKGEGEEWPLRKRTFPSLMVILQINGLSLGWPKKNQFRAVLHVLCLSKSD